MNRIIRDRITKIILIVVTVITLSPFIAIISDIMFKGILHINIELITEYPRKLGLEGGALNAIVGSILMIALACVFAMPISIGGAIYLSEYLESEKLRNILEFMVDALAGVPSIVFGAFGYIFFAYFLRLGACWLTASLTLALMMLPIMLRTAEEALRFVPIELKEAAYSLGASKWQVISNVSLNIAAPAIISGILLGIARVFGETAPLLLTTGYNFFSPSSFLEGIATMTVTIFMWVESPFPELVNRAYALGFILLIIVIGIDVLANLLSRYFARHMVK